jgi:multisubunit Na+/H+ antiporter MnhF subunit
MSDAGRQPDREIQLSAHIFSVSAGLVGGCLTVIGLFRVVVRSENVDSIADNLLAFDALLFLGACILAYLALRSDSAERGRRIERVADVVFLSALTMMVAVGGLIAYEFV